MTDPDIRRWLAFQTKGSVGHVGIAEVRSDKVKEALNINHEAGHRFIVVDALEDEDLLTIGKAAIDLPLLTGGSGIALGLPANFGITPKSKVANWVGTGGKIVALSGSCSRATLDQVAFHARTQPTIKVAAADVVLNQISPNDVVRFLMTEDRFPLAYSSADPQELQSVQTEFGGDVVASAIEDFFRIVAQELVSKGVGGIISAGGETSGAVVQGTRSEQLQIGPEIDPGVPV